MPVLVGFLIVVLTFALLRGFTRASPASLAKLIKFGGGGLALVLGALLTLRGAIGPGLTLAGLGVWLLDLNWLGLSGFRPAGQGGGGVSRVRSAMVEMELDRGTGAIRGIVLAGVHEGMPLDQLTRTQLMALHELCLTDDPEGARLLEAYFDRRFAGWRSAADGDRNAGSGRSGRRDTISEDEAYEILGLQKGAPTSEIARAHRDLMKKLHPDHGGTTDLAARVNEAKDVLMRGRQG
jgi:hypothetical protein